MARPSSTILEMLHLKKLNTNRYWSSVIVCTTNVSNLAKVDPIEQFCHLVTARYLIRPQLIELLKRFILCLI